MIVNKYTKGCGGGSGSGVTPEDVQHQIDSALTPYWDSGETKDYVDGAVSGIDLSNYYTSAQTEEKIASAVTPVANHLAEVEQVTASALTELHNGLLEVSGRTVDLSGYYTSAQTEDAISAATSGKADAANITANYARIFPTWNEQGIITGTTGNTFKEDRFYVNNGSFIIPHAGRDETPPHFYAPTTPGNAGDILVSVGGNQAPIWSAFTGGDSKTVVDFDKTTHNERAAIYTTLKALYDGGSGATINKTYDFYKTVGTKQGLKIDYYTFADGRLVFGKVVSPDNSGENAVYAQVMTVDSAGNVNVVTNTVGGGAGTGYWTSAQTKTYVDSAVTDVQDQIDTMDEVVSDALNDLNGKLAAISAATQDMVTSTTVRHLVKLTQAEYDVLTPKDPYTFYIISNSN